MELASVDLAVKNKVLNEDRGDERRGRHGEEEDSGDARDALRGVRLAVVEGGEEGREDGHQDHAAEDEDKRRCGGREAEGVRQLVSLCLRASAAECGKNLRRGRRRRHGPSLIMLRQALPAAAHRSG